MAGNSSTRSLLQSKSRTILIAVSVIILITLSAGCDSAGVLGELEPVQDLESIPFDALGGGKLVLGRIVGEPQSYFATYVIDVASRESWGFQGGSFPSLDPDGQRILDRHSKNISLNSDIYSYDLHGRNAKRFTEFGGKFTVQSLSWIPDGKQSVFTAYEYSDNGDYTGMGLFRMDMTSTSNEWIRIHEFKQNECSSVSHGRVSVSPRGELIFSVTLCQNLDSSGINLTPSGIYSLPLSGGNKHIVLTSPVESPEGYVVLWSPTWSPDGSTIAFAEVIRHPTATNISQTRIKMMDANGDDVVTLVSFEPGGTSFGAQASVAWSPDGSKIAFTRPEGTSTPLYIIGRDGQGLQRITSADKTSICSVSWSR